VVTSVAQKQRIAPLNAQAQMSRDKKVPYMASQYEQELEKRVEELQELLTMALADAAAYKCFLPYWKETSGYEGWTYKYMMRAVSIGSKIEDGMQLITLAEVKQCAGVSPDKTWYARIWQDYGIFPSKADFKFYSSYEQAKEEIEQIFVTYIHQATSK
jgi:hypothetical protein